MPKSTIILLSVITLYAIVLSVTMFHMNEHKQPIQGLRTSYKKAISSKVHNLYRKFLALFGKVPHTPAENNYRMEEFNKNYDRIAKLKIKYRGKSSFVINEFASESREEFKARLDGTLKVRQSEI